MTISRLSDQGSDPGCRPARGPLRLGLVAKAHQDDAKTIEPLDLLAGIVENRDSRLAQLLRDHGITRQNVAKALDSGDVSGKFVAAITIRVPLTSRIHSLWCWLGPCAQ